MNWITCSSFRAKNDSVIPRFTQPITSTPITSSTSQSAPSIRACSTSVEYASTSSAWIAANPRNPSR